MDSQGESFLDSYLPFLLIKGYRLISAEFHQFLLEIGITVPEVRIVNLLAEREAATLQELADGAYLPQPTASRACRRLVDRGLLHREVSAADRRSRIFRLTAQGAALSHRLIGEAEVRVARALADLTVDTDLLTETMRSLVSELEQTAPRPERPTVEAPPP